MANKPTVTVTVTVTVIVDFDSKTFCIEGPEFDDSWWDHRIIAAKQKGRNVNGSPIPHTDPEAVARDAQRNYPDFKRVSPGSIV